MSLESQKLPPLPYSQMPGNDYTAEDMRKYAQAAVEAEREACAKLCESIMPNPVNPVISWTDAQIVECLRVCAAAIRARVE